MQTLQALLGIEHAIIQAPMAGCDNAEFVAAASNAGILGSLGAQYRTVPEIEETVAHIRQLTEKPFAVNLFAPVSRQNPDVESITNAIAALQKYYDKFEIIPPKPEAATALINQNAQYDCLLALDIAALSFTLGQLDIDLIKAFKAKSTVIIGTATNLEEALALEKSGVDAICAQGGEAGGHRGTFIGSAEASMADCMTLVTQFTNTIDIPVIAAGGIMNGANIATAFAHGAAGVQMGTAFLTTDECPIHPRYKLAIQSHDGDDTEITSKFSGGPARAIRNKFIDETRDLPTLPFPFQNLLTRPFRQVANKRGDIDYTNLWCGRSGKLARNGTIAQLVKSLESEIRASCVD